MYKKFKGMYSKREKKFAENDYLPNNETEEERRKEVRPNKNITVYFII